jgi:UDP-N-acetylmuramyl tripeptide synthase
MRADARLIAAVWVGKLAMAASRVTGRGGSALPGRLALAIDPAVIRKLARDCRAGAVVVTGTNGKTTTAKMIAEILRVAGHRVAHNRSGANLASGVAAALVEAAGGAGRVCADIILAEVDEATVPAVIPDLPVRVAVVTNFLRDQLDRYGELDHTVRLVARGLARLPAGATLVLNADDPLVAGLADLAGGGSGGASGAASGKAGGGSGGASGAAGGGVRRIVFFGLEDPRHATLVQERSKEAHLGRNHCPHRGRDRPRPDVAAVAVGLRGADGSDITVTTPNGAFSTGIAPPGLYNVYNALAASAAAHALGLPEAVIAGGLAAADSSFGRMEAIEVGGGRRLRIALVKNPAGLDAVLGTVIADPCARHLIIAINDRHADGTDVSWLWDGDFERLAQADTPPEIITSGRRAADMAVRLKYAGCPPGRITVRPRLDEAIGEGLARVREGETLYLLPTYTAMLEARDLMRRRGYARHFWQV